MMKKSILIVIVVVLLCGLFFTGIMIDTLYRAPDRPDGVVVRFDVEQGTPFSTIVARLSRQGMIRRPRLFSWYAIARGFDRAIDVGTYEFIASERPADILEKLVTGDVLKVAVTIPEGKHMWEVAGIVSAQAGIDSSGFASFLSNPETSARFGIDAPTLEGYLFPETYVVPWGIAETTMVRVMVSRLREVLAGLREISPGRTGMNMNEVVTLASIIEAEARLPEERALISAVYHNRIARGMKLEADPTVAYAMGGYRGRLLYDDLLIDSPYNTYRHAGLPPGPICNPGRASIAAALAPDSSCRALYFVARGDGGHIFSLTHKEHLAAVAAVRKQRGGK